MNKQTDFAQFSAEMHKTAEAFNAEMTPGRAAIYFDDLEDLSLEAVIGALQYTRKTSDFFPKIAQLRKFAEGSADDKAELAWRTFVDLVKFEGEYPSLQIYDGGIAYAITCMGGWCTAVGKLGDASPEMVASYAKEFKNSYKLGAMRNDGPQYLIGAVEANNRTLGQWKNPTVDQPVCLVRPGRVVKLVMPLDVAEGRLTADARKALDAGGESLKRYLPAPTKPVKILNPAPGAEMATPEEVDELKGKILRLVPRS